MWCEQNHYIRTSLFPALHHNNFSFPSSPSQQLLFSQLSITTTSLFPALHHNKFSFPSSPSQQLLFSQLSITTTSLFPALHHNNCLYLAHHLLTLGHQFQSQLPKPLTMVSVSFVDLVPKLRRLGTECFIRCLRKQRDELIGCLKNARGNIFSYQSPMFSN